MRTWRCFWLYLGAGLLLCLLLRPSTAHLNRLNYLKQKERSIKAFELGEGPLSREDLRWTIRYYRLILEKNPRNDVAYGNLGFCYFYMKDYVRAVKAYQKAIEIRPEYYSFYWDLGYLSLRINQPNDAVTFFERALENLIYANRYFDQLIEKTHLLKREDLTFLIDDLQSRIKRDEELAYEFLGESYHRLKKYEMMNETLRRGMARFSQNVNLNRWMGICGHFLGRPAEAIGYLNKAIELDPQDEEAYYYRALCLSKLGLGALSVKDFQKMASIGKEKAGRQERPQNSMLHLNTERMILEYQLY